METRKKKKLVSKNESKELDKMILEYKQNIKEIEDEVNRKETIEEIK